MLRAETVHILANPLPVQVVHIISNDNGGNKESKNNDDNKDSEKTEILITDSNKISYRLVETDECSDTCSGT